jgi:hypothetical protein
MENGMIRHRKTLVLIALGAIIVVLAFALQPTVVADAQCGSQASSCKNCHEIQGELPVNTTGDWHVSHAFGDFCEFCHAGNVQAPEADQAHTGMVAPLEDVQAGCAACHPSDPVEKAEIYAAVLGVAVGSGGGGSSASASGSSNTAASSGAADSEPILDNQPEMVTTGSVIDYDQQYAETVLGERNINVGNVILTALIALVAVGGGAFVFFNERRLGGFGSTDELSQTESINVQSKIEIEGISPDVAALLPEVEKLNPLGRRALARLLNNPEIASDLLHHLSRLDPELINTVRGLDRETRALLLAMAGQ